MHQIVFTLVVSRSLTHTCCKSTHLRSTTYCLLSYSCRAILQVVEAFLDALIHISYERYVLGIGNVTNRDIIRRDIIHQLAVEPKPHSNLKKKVTSNPEMEEHFDGILEEVADFRKTSSEYHLKPTFTGEVDVHYHRYTAKEREDAEAKMLEKMLEKRKMQGLIPPVPLQLCPAFRSLQDLATKAPVLQVIHTILCRAGGGWIPPTTAVEESRSPGDAAASSEGAAQQGSWQNCCQVLVNERVIRQCKHSCLLLLFQSLVQRMTYHRERVAMIACFML